MSGKGKYAEKKLAKAAAVENTAKVHSTTAQAEKAESLATKTLSEDSVNDWMTEWEVEERIFSSADADSRALSS